ncbi:MAG: hypothetical protein K6B72_00485 [Lachnospiraceae bacterium]|nr:hypothetical protein [Lachnospiraceae bacterium]
MQRTSSSSSSSGSGSRPVSRERNSSSSSARSSSRRGGGLNLGGPVGNGPGYSDRPTRSYGGRSGGGGGISFFALLMTLLVGAVIAIFVKGYYDGYTPGETVDNIVENVQDFVSDLQGNHEKNRAEKSKDKKKNKKSDEDDEDDGGSERSRSLSKVSRDLAASTEVSDFSGLLSSQAEDFIPLLKNLESGDSVAPGNKNKSIDADKFFWSENDQGQQVLKLSDEDWDFIDTVKLNVFLDDGEGYIDLGLDALFDFDENLDLIGEYDGTWMCIERQPVAYYHLQTTGDEDDYEILGYVPAFWNDEHVNIIVVFDSDTPKGYIKGVKLIEDGPGNDLSVNEMTTGLKKIKEGDTLDFICDYYDYDGNFINNYFFGDTLEVEGSMKDLEIKNYVIDGATEATYLLTDSEGDHYWTPIMN